MKSIIKPIFKLVFFKEIKKYKFNSFRRRRRKRDKQIKRETAETEGETERRGDEETGRWSQGGTEKRYGTDKNRTHGRRRKERKEGEV